MLIITVIHYRIELNQQLFLCMTQKLREDLENKLSLSLASMEQELRKCTFDEGGTGLVYLQNIPADDQV